MRIQINKGLGEFQGGQVVEVQDIDGVPLERYWRKRLKDAKIDNCCEVIPKEKPVSKPTKVKTTKSIEGEG